MANNKSLVPKTDWNQVLDEMYHRDKSAPMGVKEPDLLTKLIEILYLAEKMLRYAETEHKHKILKVTQNYQKIATPVKNNIQNTFRFANQLISPAEESPYVPLSSGIVAALRLNHQRDDYVLLEAYFGIHAQLNRIYGAIYFYLRYELKVKTNRQSAVTYMLKLASEGNEVPVNFLKNLTPLFFTLHLHCHEMVLLAASPRGMPADRYERKVRASKAATAKHNGMYGEEVLKNETLQFLKNLPKDEKLTKLKNLTSKHYNDLEIILEEYKKRVKNNEEHDGKTLKYGDKLTTDGFIIKINRWVKIDKNFRDVLNDLILEMEKEEIK